MKHFYLLLAALVCSPLLAQKPVEFPNRLLTPQHQHELPQHIGEPQRIGQQQRKATPLLQTMAKAAQTRATQIVMLYDYVEEFDKNGNLCTKKVYTYDDLGRVASVADYDYTFADGIVWQGEQTAAAWVASDLRFSDTEGELPSISDGGYRKMVGKTLHLDVTDVAGGSTSLKIMNGWWSATYYEFKNVQSGQTVDFEFTQEMCDDCIDKDLTILNMGTAPITVSKLYFDVDKEASSEPMSKTEYTYDANGNTTCVVDYEQQNGELVYRRKSEYAFDANGIQTMNGDYYWEDGAWACTYKYEQLFDENGRHIGTININPYWKNSKQEYLYDATGKLLGYLIYGGQEDQWTLESKTEYTYKDSTIVTGSFSYAWKDNDWVPNSKSELTLDENNRLASEITYSLVDGEWVGSYKYEYTYDENGRETFSASYNWADGEWVGSYKYEYTYDSYGNQTSYASYNWADGEWVGSYKYEYTYDDHGNQTSYTSYIWEDDEWVVSYKHKNEFEYNNNGNLISSTGYSWSDGEWYKLGKEEYIYDENNNRTKYLMYSCRNNEWVLTRTYVYHYIPFEPKPTVSISPAVEEGTEIDEQNAKDISEFKMELNNVETFEVNDNASAELLLDDVLAGTASKENISEENGVVTIKFKLTNNDASARTNFAAMLSARTRAASDDVKVEIRIAAGSFSINEEVVNEELAYSYYAPATVVEVIESVLSIEGIAAEETAAPVYTLQGIRSNKDPKGLMIKNGKKIYVK